MEERLLKKVRTLQDIQATTDTLLILNTLTKWRELKSNKELDAMIEAIMNLAQYINLIQMNRDAYVHIVEDLRHDRNHYAERSMEAEQELRKDNKDRI